jgi:hypothetical protein
MAQGRIAIVALRLEQRGIDPGHLRVLQEELDVIERPPGIFGRLSAALKQKAATQWGHLVGELRESAEVMGLISGRLRNQRPLTPEERDKVRAQMLDLLKVVPAGLIAVGNAALPIPGTGIFTPWILVKLGLMPSRWREAHLLDQLQREQARLREQGHSDEAEELQALYNALEEEADAREAAAREAALLTHWDANQNGVWDDDERAAYAQEVARLQSYAARQSSAKRWFLQAEGQVFGPYRLSELAGADVPADLLTCLDGRTGWVSLADVLAAPSS